MRIKFSCSPISHGHSKLKFNFIKSEKSNSHFSENISYIFHQPNSDLKQDPQSNDVETFFDCY